MKKLLAMTVLGALISCNVVNIVTGDKPTIDSSFSDGNNNHHQPHHQCIKPSSNPDSISLSSNLVTFFHFDEDNGLRNGVGGSINLVETGSVGSEPGICGKALDTDTYDNSNYLKPSNHSPLAFGMTTDFSIAFWIKFDPTTDGYQFVQGDDNNISEDMYVGFYNSSGNIKIEVWMSIAGNVFSINNFLSTDSNWNHVAIVFDRGTDSRLYLNGNLHNTNSSVTNTTNLNDTVNEHIGGKPYSVSMTPIKGAIDEYGIWNKALTHNEVIQLHKKEYNF